MLKHFFTLCVISLFLVSCKQEKKYATISGEITNLDKSITQGTIYSKNGVKQIAITDGKFSDTINLNGNYIALQIGKAKKELFLRNNYNLHLTANFKDYLHTMKFSGVGSETNNYLVQRDQKRGMILNNSQMLHAQSKKDFTDFLANTTVKMLEMIDNTTNIDSIVVRDEKMNLPSYIKQVKQQYKTANNLTSFWQKGDTSPEFKNLMNYKGGTTSLSDLKGNYVYIDLWATWCPPCKAEIPFLKKLEKQYHHKNIKFVSISIDNPNDEKKWRNFVKDKNLGGIQLFANNDLSFLEAYEVMGIPKFILIDTEGKIIFENAPRPSSGEMENVFKYLK